MQNIESPDNKRTKLEYWDYLKQAFKSNNFKNGGVE